MHADSLKQAVNSLKPSGNMYKRLQQALTRYRNIQHSGGWPTVPAGKVLKPGMRDIRVPAVRRRLAFTADIESNQTSQPELFDDELEVGVKRFQARHGLADDGVVGPDTLTALNVPVQDKINVIRVNLERARWLLHNVSTRTAVVNIADFRLYLGKVDDLEWSTRVVVGKPYHKTPLFKSLIEYIVVNPTWTVPPGITKNEMVPKMIKDAVLCAGE